MTRPRIIVALIALEAVVFSCVVACALQLAPSLERSQAASRVAGAVVATSHLIVGELRSHVRGRLG